MHNQTIVGVGDRFQHVEKQSDTRFDPEPVLIAVTVNVVALDVLENEIRLPSGRYPRIDQLGNVRMRQTAEYDSFALESFFAASPDESDFEKLHSYFSRKSRVVSFREPDAAHATLADLRYERVGAHRLTREAGFIR